MLPMVEEPPLTAKLDRPPDAKLSCTDATARDKAWVTGAMAARPAARPTPPRPEATPDAPDCPAEASV